MLAAALARDEDVREAFYDGILWITLGESPNLVQSVVDLLYVLTGSREGSSDLGPIAHRLKEALEHKRCLLVADDVWAEGHLRPLLDGAAQVTRLITTRRNDILPAGVARIDVDAMSSSESVALLARGLADAASPLRDELSRLARERLGDWPLLLAQVSGFLAQRVAQGEPAEDALRRVVERLERRGLTAFDPALERDRAAAVDKTVGVGLDMLAEFDKKGRTEGFHARRLSELAVFPEDADVPMATVARLWDRTAGVARDEAEELLERFFNLALVQRFDLRLRTMRLHDVMRRYLIDRAGDAALSAFHRQLVAAFGAVDPSIANPGDERLYYYEQLPFHLHHAKEHGMLESLLVDPAWMQRKVDALGSVLPLVRDYERFGATEAGNLVGRSLRLTSRIITRDSRQLAAQLIGRLPPRTGLETLLSAARRQVAPPALIPARQTLSSPGTEWLRLEAPNEVHAVVAMTNDTVATGDRAAVRIWSLTTGEEVARLPAGGYHIDRLSDGGFVCADLSGTIRWFDLRTRSPSEGFARTRSSNASARCQGAASPADRIRTDAIRIRDLGKRRVVARLAGHESGVTALCWLGDDGLLASASVRSDGPRVEHREQEGSRSIQRPPALGHLAMRPSETPCRIGIDRPDRARLEPR